ncbi:FliH/SctL family protein [Ectobacillus antri]|jgi:flagellar assembly protein FliH|uniref:FliH/SctL family protein n=1 Tax=Ectobacillus antri TaxID=2486280 RepID=A0ABT6H1M4_9BACI|nr:FliH/SctL family protein [Ectobacillus antri]MDG4656197.1 FliH/SctL family protein [Ectobacillus antri]MDG5752872.1 FliH/SctL family protein [Ectobacillus antri]
MSLFKNRIPRNSVSFSDEQFKLRYSTEEKDEYVIPQVDIVNFTIEKEQLQKEREELAEVKRQLELREQALQQAQLQFLADKQRLEEELAQQEVALSQERQQLHYEVREFLWDNTLKLAEKVVNQAIDTKQLSMLEILTGIVETLPIAFEKLRITVHPDTYEYIQQEEARAQWLLGMVEWKFDFSLGLGEFVLEEEKEYFEYRIGAIFKQLRERVTEVRAEGEEMCT